MPSTATMTAFYTFTPLTTIYSAQVNNNFNLFRGTICPVDGSLSAFSNKAYDLGSVDYFWRGIYGQQIVLYGETAPSNPPAGSYKFYIKAADSTAYIKDSAGVETEIGTGGGGGGITLNWIQTGGNSPLEDVFSNDKVYLFDASLSQELFTAFKIPDTYEAGTQVNLKIGYTCTATSGTVLFSSQATLIKKDTTVYSATTNQHSSTNVAVTLSASANRINEATLDLSNATGLINSVTITAGDIIKVKLFRGTDTATPEARFHPYLYEVITV